MSDDTAQRIERCDASHRKAEHIGAAFHEVDVFLWFTDNGLSPYWALGKLCIGEYDGHGEVDMQLSDGDWHVRLNYNPKTGIAPRDGDPIGGDRAYEFKIHAEGPGQKKADFVFSPRWDDQRKPDGDLMRRPWCGGEGVQVHAQGSNLTYDEYLYILQTSLQALAGKTGMDYSRRYFNRPRPESNIVTTELYLRLVRDMSMKLVRSSGVFFKIMHLLADQKGMEWTYSGDNTEIVGKRHAFDLTPAASNELVDGHRLGKRLKCYHPKHVRNEETQRDPLSSPKFGAAFHKSLSDSAVKWQDRDDLLRELEESLINVLRWAGVPVVPDETTFVEDDHFSVRPSDRQIGLFSDPTPELEAEQDVLIRRVLSDLSPSADVLLREVATDGGKRINDIAEDAGYHISTIYRAINEVSDLVVNNNGMVRMYSEKIRQEIEAVTDDVENQVMSAANRIAKLCKVETRSAADSALQQWMNKYAIEFENLGDVEERGRIRIDTVLSMLKFGDEPSLSDVFEEGYKAWTSAGRDGREFDRLEYRAKKVRYGGDEAGLVRRARLARR